MKYHIITYGCQMNRSDSERIAAVLESKNYQHSPTLEGADLVIINMCSVRQKPVDKAKNQILRLKDKKIILTGCILSKDKKEFQKKFQKLNIEFKEFSKGLPSTDSVGVRPLSGLVPIMRGCNNFCSYCAVPYTRGREKYRPQKEIICEIKQIIKKGTKEITLLGQNVNSYPNFVKLLQKITAFNGNFKIKFITNHPKDFSDELIKEMARNHKIAKCVHLPFQAGSNKILKKMNRGYTKQQYLKLIQKIKKAILDVEITTDIIVGFPSETKKDFQETIDIFKKAQFVNAFVAKYSPRPGATASKLKDNITLVEKKRREQTLKKLIETRSLSDDRERVSKKLIVILGPTAVGKTGLSIKLAKMFNGEIVSADSRQVYHKMDIGTNKVNKKEMQGIPHYLLDITSLKRKFSVAQYQQKAIETINNIAKKGKAPFLVGGSPFYIYSVIEGWQFPKMKKNPVLRKQLEKKTAEELLKMLKKIDLKRAKTIEPKNKRRLIRAIEIAKSCGRVPQLKKNPQFDCLLLGLGADLSKEKLEQRIEKRIDEMLKQGLEKEVKKLVKKYGFNSVLKETIGYAEWQGYLNKNYSIKNDRHYLKQNQKEQISEIVKQIKQNTLRLAKHQMTWFKRDERIHWLKNQKQAEKFIKDFLNA